MMRKLARMQRWSLASNLAALALSCSFTVGAHASASGRTALVIHNATSEPVQVGVILAALGGACPEGHPPVTADQLAQAGFCSQVVESGNPPYAGKCLLTLKANSSINFPDFPNTCISGNVTFGGYASCPNPPTFPNGTTTAEFTLNPASGSEAVDISLVNGYSGVASISMQGGGGWTYGPEQKKVSKIQNNPSGQNVGNPGVYPEDCTDCIGLGGSPVCPGFSKNPVCQTAPICNVQRSVYGGTVTITLIQMQ